MEPVIVSALLAALLAGAGAAWWFGRRRADAAWSFVPEAADADDAAAPAMDPALLPRMRRRFLRAALGIEDDVAELPDAAGHRQIADTVIAVLERADLSQRYIPRRPHLLPQLIQSVNDSTASARSIGRIIGSDPLLTVNLLRGLAMVMVVRATADAYSRRQTLAPSPALLLSLLERCTPQLAARIARAWQLSADVAAALEAGGQGVPSTPLARSLQVGELAAALSMLCREGLLEEAQALETLSACVPGHVGGWLWKRVSPDAPGEG